MHEDGRCGRPSFIHSRTSFCTFLEISRLLLHDDASEKFNRPSKLDAYGVFGKSKNQKLERSGSRRTYDYIGRRMIFGTVRSSSQYSRDLAPCDYYVPRLCFIIFKPSCWPTVPRRG